MCASLHIGFNATEQQIREEAIKWSKANILERNNKQKGYSLVYLPGSRGHLTSMKMAAA